MIKKFLGKLSLGQSGSFKNNALIMSSGALLNVIISLGLYPIVTRLYTKEQFGVLGLFLSVTGILSLFGTFLYPTAFVIPKFKRTFYALLKLTLYLSLTFLFLTCLIMFFFKNELIKIFELESIRILFPLIPIFVFLSFVRDIAVNWNVRNKDFKKNAFSNIIGSLSLKVSNISFAVVFSPTTFFLILSSFISIIISISLLGVNKMRKDFLVIGRIRFDEIKEVSNEYKMYPISILPGNLINRITSDLPIYLFTIHFSPAATGAYVLANTILNVPINVIGGSIASVFLQSANELYLKDKLKLSQFTSNINLKLILIGSICFGFLFNFSDILFPFIFGSDWELAGQMASILSLYLIFKLVSSPIARVFRVVKKEEYTLYVSLILAVARSVGIVIGVYTNDLLSAVFWFSGANAIGYIVTYILVFKAVDLPIFRNIVKSTAVIIIVFFLFYLIRMCFNQI